MQTNLVDYYFLCMCFIDTTYYHCLLLAPNQYKTNFKKLKGDTKMFIPDIPYKPTLKLIVFAFILAIQFVDLKL